MSDNYGRMQIILRIWFVFVGLIFLGVVVLGVFAVIELSHLTPEGIGSTAGRVTAAFNHAAKQ